jgi:hypothetical protein
MSTGALRFYRLVPTHLLGQRDIEIHGLLLINDDLQSILFTDENVSQIDGDEDHTDKDGPTGYADVHLRISDGRKPVVSTQCQHQ